MNKKILVTIFLILNILYPRNLAVEISSPSAVVICNESGRILYNKNAKEQRKMASLTKMMTAILLVENCEMNEQITIDKRACYIGGSEAGIKPNDNITAENLLYGMLLPSGNDCAMAIGYHIGGTIENFAAMMNKKAKELGLEDTNFENPHGLDSENHYTSAYSMALISRYALSYKKIRDIVATKEVTINLGSFTKQLRNTNSLLRTYDKADGGKTGFTNGANRCLVASATEDNLKLIAVVLGSETSSIRFNDAKSILEDTFSKYMLYDISNFLNIYINIPIFKGTETTYIDTYRDTKKIALTEDEYSKIYVSENFIDKIQAPMNAGTYIGTYTVSIEDEVLYTKDFYLQHDILKKTPFDYFISNIKNMFSNLELI
ncbi:MAG: D-alanyl-D-alanine carboxypeptidase [Clostridia bacterium]|nr:D-alanyl-D-alanine carboxypeptidase [Clostridia bacterium]